MNIWEHVCEIADESTAVECGIEIKAIMFDDPNPLHDHRYIMLMLQLIHEMSIHPMYFEATHPFAPDDVFTGLDQFKKHALFNSDEKFQLVLSVAAGEQVLNIFCNGNSEGIRFT